MMLPETTTTYEWRVAYISDGSVEDLLNKTEEEADWWVDYVNAGQVEDVEPGDAFKQRRKVVTTKHPWESVLDA